MQPIEIRPGIFWVGMNDRRTELFEGLWPIGEQGVSYNSYLINDEKKAVIDLSSLATTEDLIEQIASITDPSQLDYVIINHMEPDHSGALKLMLKISPKVQLVGTAKTAEMLETFYGITENVMVVKDGDFLDLGKHHLKFFSTPFVHWPETMMTYDVNEKILFSCDGFGGYGSLNGTIFDDANVPLAWYEKEALRYYANIVVSFSKPVRNAITKLEGVPISIIAPSHGLVWRQHPERIVELYRKWATYSIEPAENGITLLYGSMYGNTKKMMEVVAQGVMDAGIPINVFNVSRIHPSYILPSLLANKGVLIGAPTYEGALFPDMAHILHVAQEKHIFNRLAAGFGSCAWLGGGQRELALTAESLKWQFSGSLEFHGAPELKDLEEGRKFGREFAEKIQGFTFPGA